MREKILTYIERNSRVDLKDLAIMLGTDEAAVANEIADMEKEGVICGYHTLIDWDKTSSEKVTALIEVEGNSCREALDLTKCRENLQLSGSRLCLSDFRRI